jgi:hypothetical protein
MDGHLDHLQMPDIGIFLRLTVSGYLNVEPRNLYFKLRLPRLFYMVKTESFGLNDYIKWESNEESRKKKNYFDYKENELIEHSIDIINQAIKQDWDNLCPPQA